MKKISTLFIRDFENKECSATREVAPGCEWVIEGEGIATQKFDGTCCMIKDGKLYKRYDAKNGKTPPEDFMPAQPEPDPVTKHWPGWVPVKEDSPDDKYHLEAWEKMHHRYDGTYELVGPKVQSNPENVEKHELWAHGMVVLHDCPRDYDSLKGYLEKEDIEGVVWHHQDGRVVKLKKSDFGFKR